MAARKRAEEEKPVTFEDLEQLIDRYVETQRAFLLTMARRVTMQGKERDTRPRSSGGRKQPPMRRDRAEGERMPRSAAVNERR